MCMVKIPKDLVIQTWDEEMDLFFKHWSAVCWMTAHNILWHYNTPGD